MFIVAIKYIFNFLCLFTVNLKLSVGVDTKMLMVNDTSSSPHIAKGKIYRVLIRLTQVELAQVSSIYSLAKQILSLGGKNLMLKLIICDDSLVCS